LQTDLKTVKWELNLVGFVGYVCALNVQNCLECTVTVLHSHSVKLKLRVRGKYSVYWIDSLFYLSYQLIYFS
jgi:hypothetical protein